MNSSEVIFTSYCFGNKAAQGDYKPQQDRLRESILKIYPNANLLFEYEPEETGKPRFQKSMYGFKVHMVNKCRAMGFKKIIFFDAAICLEQPVDYWFEQVKTYGVLSAVDRATLDKVSSNKVLAYLGLSRGDVSSWYLAGGSIYVFDFDTELTQRIFNKWEELEREGLFGQQEDISAGRLEGHRMDETCMSLSMYLSGSHPVGHDIMRYAYEHPETKLLHSVGDYEPIVIKRHFK